MDEFFSSFQHDLFSRNVDGGDRLEIYTLFRQTPRGDSQISRTVEVRNVTPNLILRSAAVLHSILEASVINALLSFVLQLWLGGWTEWIGRPGLPVDGRVRFL